MPLDLDVSGRTVLLDGTDARTAGTVHTLLAAGASVTVAATSLPTSLRDLVERDLLQWCPRADSRDFDLVLRTRAGTGGDENNDPGDPAAAANDLNETQQNAGGQVILLGGGPGDPGLITVAGLEALRQADIVVYDRLAPLACLEEVPAHAVLIDVGKIPRGEFTEQERINRVLVEHAGQGRTVVRFKGGDSFVFGRGGEEAQACAAAGVPVKVIPGVSASIAAPELAGIPVTHRTLTQGFSVVSGHLAPGDPNSSLDWSALAKTGTTLVVLMGVAQLVTICDALLAAGLDPDTPAATIADAGLPSMAIVRARVEDLAVAVEESGIGAPAVTVVGSVAGLNLGGMVL